MDASKNNPITREELVSYYIATETAANKRMNTLIDNAVQRIKDDLSSSLSVIQGNIAKTKELVDDTIKSIGLIDGRINKMAELYQSLEKKQDSFAEQQKSIGTMLNKSVHGIKRDLLKASSINVNNIANEPKLVNSISDADSIKWHKVVKDTCNKIANRRNLKYLDVCKDIYEMMLNDGDNFWDLYNIWKTVNLNGSVISMFSKSDYYRQLFEKYMKELHKEYFPELYTFEAAIAKSLQSVDLMKTPDAIRQCVNKYAEKNNISYTAASSRIYRKFNMTLGYNTTVKRREFARTFGYKNCSPGFYIANNNDLFELFKKIAEEK